MRAGSERGEVDEGWADLRQWPGGRGEHQGNTSVTSSGKPARKQGRRGREIEGFGVPVRGAMRSPAGSGSARKQAKRPLSMLRTLRHTLRRIYQQ